MSILKSRKKRCTKRVAILRNLKGAESGILVRSGGFLDLDYSTINGPAYGLQTNKTYINTAKYPSPVDPVWKVGEIFTPSDYFEENVSDVRLEVNTSSPKVCTTTPSRRRRRTTC